MKLCSVEGCERRHWAKGLCNPHWGRARRNNGDPGSATIAKIGATGCAFDGCVEKHSAGGLCNSHYAQRRRGVPLTPIAYRTGPTDPRWLAIRSRYGLEREQYEAIMERQRWCCAICGGQPSGARDFHVDHDHAHCGPTKGCAECVRGILCDRCNIGLGRFRDSVDLLRKAAEYLTGSRV